MRKHGIAAVALAAIVVALASPAMAFQSVSITTVTAKVTTGGQKVAQFTLAIRDVTAPFGASTDTIRWSGVDPLTTVWKRADQLLVINSTVTDQNGGIKIYTDNTAADAVPRFVDPTPGNATNPDSSAGGLLEADTSTTSVSKPLAWSIKAATNTIPAAANPNDNGNGLCGFPTDSNAFQWLFATDKFNWASGIDFDQDGDVLNCGDALPQALDAKYPTMIKHSGIHFGQADNEFGALGPGKNAFVYFQANFVGTKVQTPYKTSTLRIEAYIE